MNKSNGKNIPKMKDDFQENDQILVMDNLEKSWKMSWKVMDFKSSTEYEPCLKRLLQ